jgi:hypothetical protein
MMLRSPAPGHTRLRQKGLEEPMSLNLETAPPGGVAAAAVEVIQIRGELRPA